jgi:hypothetical protein
MADKKRQTARPMMDLILDTYEFAADCIENRLPRQQMFDQLRHGKRVNFEFLRRQQATFNQGDNEI